MKPIEIMTFLRARRPEKALRAPTRTVQHSQKQYKNEWLRAPGAFAPLEGRSAPRGTQLFNIAVKTNRKLDLFASPMAPRGPQKAWNSLQK